MPTADHNQKKMNVIAIDRFGPASVLKIHTLPVPEPGPGEVLIAVACGGRRRLGRGYARRLVAGRAFQIPLVLGTDGAGVIAAKGKGTRRFKIGDRVWAYEFINPKGGFYAEYVAIKASNVAPVPARLDLLHAGASAVTGLTALQGIDDHLRVRRGTTVLIFGATGAVGTLAVQFAKRHRARVIGTARGRAGEKLVKKLGANAVIDPSKKDVAERLRVLAPGGVDAVLVLTGGKNLESLLDLTRPGGRIAYPNGVEPTPHRRPKVRTISYDGIVSPKHFSRLNRAVEETRLQVPIAAIYPLAQAVRAQERLKRGHVLGRIVLRIRR